MPMYKNPFEKGRLIITFDVKFPSPDQISPKMIAELEKILPAKPSITVPKDAETLQLIDLDPAYERSRRSDAHGDEDMEGGPKRVQCANQ